MEDGDSKYPKEHWACRLAGGAFVAAMRAAAAVVRLFRSPGWKSKIENRKSIGPECGQNDCKDGAGQP